MEPPILRPRKPLDGFSLLTHAAIAAPKNGYVHVSVGPSKAARTEATAALLSEFSLGELCGAHVTLQDGLVRTALSLRRNLLWPRPSSASYSAASLALLLASAMNAASASASAVDSFRPHLVRRQRISSAFTAHSFAMR